MMHKGNAVVWLVCFLTFIFGFKVQESWSADWPQYGGVGRDGVSTEENLIEEWPEGGPVELWSADVGVGGGSCAIVGDKVYVLGALDDPASEERRPPKRDSLICLNNADGVILWAQPLGDFTKESTYHSPHATPTVKDGLVYSISRKAHLFCNDAETGELLWDVDTVPMMGGADHDHYGYSCSPLVEDGRVIMWSRYGDEGISDEALEQYFTEADRKKLAELDPEKRSRWFWRLRSAVLAFDAKTGAPLWRSKALAGSTRSDLASPVSGIFHGRKQVIWPTGEQLAAVAPEDGSVLWQFDYKQAFGLDDLGQSHSNMKPAIHGDLVIDNLWNHKPTNRTFAVRVTEDGPVLAWDTQTLASWYHPVIAWKDMLIGLDNQGIPGSTGPACKGTRPPEIGMLQCYDIQTGEMLWNTNKFDPTMPEQLLHRSRHSFIIVNDKMIIQSPRGGVAFVDIERSGSHVFGSFDTEQRGPGYSQPAFSNGQLFIRRANGPLSCYELGKD